MVPRTIRLDKARCLTSKKFEPFCTGNNIEPIYMCVYLGIY